MKDINDRKDIRQLVASFYEKVRKDASLGYIFDEVIKVDWAHHIPVIEDFWETQVLDTGHYQRNTMAVHFDINKRVPLNAEHFSQWLHLFFETVDENFKGANANKAKQKAKSIAQLMQFKLGNHHRFDSF